MASPAPATLLRDDIARRIPHQGSMCLLERVTAWDSQQIACEAISHRAADNPLRAHGRLGATCGIEYAAQAMAVHGALIAEAGANAGPVAVLPGSAPPPGYLVSVRSVILHVDRLDEQAETLRVQAGRTSGDAATILYSFTVHAGTSLLLSGRAAVVLNALTPKGFP